MKKILNTFIFLLSITSFAQSTSDIGKVQLAIAFSEEQANTIDQSLLLKLEAKLTQLLSNNGIVSTDYNNSQTLQPSIIINNVDGIEGGMQNINVTRITLQLLIKQNQTQKIFASFSKELKGTGRTKDLSINNAINSISSNDSSIVKFLEEGKQKITQYYNENCNLIINKSSNFDKYGKYEESLALLMSIPENASCYNQAQKKALETYSNLQKKNCSSLIKEAQAKIAEKDYSNALGFLVEIDSSSPCNVQSNNLIKSIENKISAEEKKQLDLYLKLHNDEVAIEKHRIDAVKEIASSYYKSQKRPNQILIIK